MLPRIVHVGYLCCCFCLSEQYSVLHGALGTNHLFQGLLLTQTCRYLLYLLIHRGLICKELQVWSLWPLSCYRMWLLYILKLKGCGVQAALKSLGLGNVNYAFIEEGSQAERGRVVETGQKRIIWKPAPALLSVSVVQGRFLIHKEPAEKHCLVIANYRY